MPLLRMRPSPLDNLDLRLRVLADGLEHEPDLALFANLLVLPSPHHSTRKPVRDLVIQRIEWTEEETEKGRTVSGMASSSQP